MRELISKKLKSRTVLPEEVGSILSLYEEKMGRSLQVSIETVSEMELSKIFDDVKKIAYKFIAQQRPGAPTLKLLED